MKDIVIDQYEGEKLRTITTTNVIWLLVAGWIFYFVSLLLNLGYYLMHPSSPEMWTWGAEEVLEEWTPPEETNKQSTDNNRGHNDQLEASPIELVELLPS